MQRQKRGIESAFYMCIFPRPSTYIIRTPIDELTMTVPPVPALAFIVSIPSNTLSLLFRQPSYVVTSFATGGLHGLGYCALPRHRR